MTVIELKKRLIKEINHSNNSGILQEMYRLISNEEVDDTIYELSNEQIAAVEEAQNQFKKGQYLKSEEADKNILYLCK